MKMNAATWISIVAAMFGIGIAFISVTASSAGGTIPALIVVAFTGLIFLFFFKYLIKPALNAIRLKKTGLPGTARILSVKDTGMTINNSPVISMEVEVKDQFGLRYTASLRALISRTDPHAYQPGMEIAVKIDPNNKENIIIDDESRPASKTRPQPITNTDTTNEETANILRTGRPAKAIIRNYNLLGTNGNQLDIALDLEVMPEVYPAFSGKTRLIIREEDIPKYQPGAEVKVKYDLYENEKIVVDPD